MMSDGRSNECNGSDADKYLLYSYHLLSPHSGINFRPLTRSNSLFEEIGVVGKRYLDYFWSITTEYIGK